MWTHIRSNADAYLLAIFAPLAALLLYMRLMTALDIDTVLFLMMGVILAVAWRGGIYPGLVATALSAIITLFLLTTTRAGVPGYAYLLPVLMFTLLGVLIVLGSEAKRRAVARADQRSEELHVTLSSIGDAVITTDIEGNVTSLNPVAEALTGWTQADALGQPLTTVFEIVNEHTRQPVDNPALRALAQGTIVGLANHTILLNRHGWRYPIDDSAAPIKDDKGKLLGAVLIFRDITARREVEQRLQENEERFRALVKATAHIVWTTDPTGEVKEDSPTWRDFTGQSYEEWKGWGWLDAIHPDDQEYIRKIWSAAVAKRSTAQFDYRLRRADGDYRWTSVRAVPVLGGDGEIREWVGMNVDITEQRQAAERLRESERRYRLVSEAANDAIWDRDLTTNDVTWNESVQTGFGYKEVSPTSQWWYDHIHPDDRERVVDEIHTVIESGQERWMSEYRFLRADGSHAFVFDRGRVVHDETGKPVRMVGSMLDLTERKEAEDALDERSRLAVMRAEISATLATGRPLHDVLQTSAERIVHNLDAAFARIWTLNTAEQRLELQASAGLYTHLDGAHSRVRVGEYKIGRIAESGSAHLTNTVADDPNISDPAWAQATGMVAFAGYPLMVDGRVVGVLALFARHTLSEAVLNDLAPLADSIAQYLDRKHAEAKLRQQEEQYRSIFDATSDAILIFDYEGTLVAANPTAYQMHGYAAGELVGMHGTQLIYPADHSKFADFITQVKAGQHFQVEGIHLRKDGSPISVDVNGTNFQYGGTPHLLAVVRDITDRKQTEIAIANQQRWLEAVLNLLPVPCLFVEPGTAVVTFSNKAADELAGGEFPKGEPGEEYHMVYYCTDANGRRIPDERMPGVRVAHGERLHNFEMDWHVGDTTHSLILWGETLPAMHGHPGTGVVMFQDINRLKKIERMLQFLADASASLAELVDYESTLQKVATVAVPLFADWRIVDLLQEGQQRRVAVVHANPQKVQAARALQEQYPPSPDAPYGLPHVLRTGKAEMSIEISDELLVRTAQNETHLSLLRDLGLKSYMCVPVISKGTVLGAITFVISESNRRYDADALQIAEDLAQRAAVAIENANLYRALREADQRKDEFLATLAHELRNPLAPIRLGLEAMRQMADNRAAVENVRNTMERQVKQLVTLVDDLMDVSRITRGKFMLRPEEVALATVVQSALEATRFFVEEGEHQLTVSLPEAPVRLIADPHRLAQVLSNLLNNAAKYTPRRGQIWLHAEEQEGEILISVKDTGVGIPEEMQERIFDMFAQINQPLEQGHTGLGIGLTLVKSLVEMHGGRVEVFSAGTNLGSEFRVWLPIASDTPARPSVTLAQGDAINFARHYRILIVDDNQAAVQMLTLVLQTQGHNVRTAGDGLEALAVAENFQPQVVLMDLGMPRLNGYETALRMRKQVWGQEAVIIALTGWGQEEDKRRTQQAGFDHHLVKPVEPATLKALLNQLSEDVP